MNSTNLHHFCQIIFPNTCSKNKNPTPEKDVELDSKKNLLLFYQFVVLDFHIPQVFQGITGTSIFEPGTKNILLGNFLTLLFQPSTIFAIGSKLIKELLALVACLIDCQIEVTLVKNLFRGVIFKYQIN